MKDSFKKVAAVPHNPKWENMTYRVSPLYKRAPDIRSCFERDYTRIIHSNAYRRLKHKTHVFFSPKDDHICTRIEHVNYVESVSYTIANFLGLNTELTRAISVAHDLGHSPFGHKGEHVLSEISKRDLGTSFWHEKNGLFLVDNIELLEDYSGGYQNLNLTYAVRDGIISHCGEINENSIKPRDEWIDLNTDYLYPNQFAPYTWEACIVKIADKISYIGRDIEDAISLGILDEHLEELYNLLNIDNKGKRINNTVIINSLIYDLCENSSPEKGLTFSSEALVLMDKIKEFNYKNIYTCDRVKASDRYFELVLNEIYNTLKNSYCGNNTFEKIDNLKEFYPNLMNSFKSWLIQYVNISDRTRFKNKVLFNLNNPKDFYLAIITYISGMTDKFAIEIYNEIIGF